jgi:hypothetical protein
LNGDWNWKVRNKEDSGKYYLPDDRKEEKKNQTTTGDNPIIVSCYMPL